MKNILFLTYENPYTRFSGDSIYTANVLDVLSDMRCNIDLVYYDSNRLEPTIPIEKQKLYRECYSVKFNRRPKWTLIFSLLPGMIASRKKRSYLQLVQKLVNEVKYDEVFINHFRMSFVFKVMPISLKTIYISHNSEYKLSINNAHHELRVLHKTIYLWDALRTYYYERRVIRVVDSYSAICEYDREALSEYYTRDSVILRPILNPGIYSSNFSQFTNNIKNLIVVGSFTWGPKAQNIIRLVREFNRCSMYEEGFRLLIVGRIENSLSSKLHEIDPRVEITGLVDDLEEFYTRASIALIPESMGGGFKLKVAEAALRGKAIFSVSGAITKCNLNEGEHFLEYENLEDMFMGIQEEIRNPEFIWKMARDAMATIKRDNTKENLKLNLSILME